MTHQLDLFPMALQLYRIEPDQNMRRFYRLCLQPDLFGGCTLIKEWGRIGSGGHVRHDRFSSEGQALNALIKASEAKARRGYFRKS